jgi:2-polyprenyl-3-methyl-5-hydroxy-6-metoxy-1,4-benzoquinol methylase
MQPEEHILRSWHANADPWASAIEEQQIESRRLVTNKAIVDTLAAYKPGSLLDAGCGEGWLCRAAADAIPSLKKITGLDAISGLIAKAAQQGTGNYHVASYQDIIEERFVYTEKADIISINFALFGNELVEKLLGKILPWIAPGGKLIIQTLHPHTATGELPYEDGWRNGSWTGFSANFTDPAPWYFRTLQSWISLVRRCGYTLIELKEPIHPITHKAVSVIFVLEVKT